MSVSVVIPTWNGAGLIAAALHSLDAQTVTPLETIVVDNGSGDGTVALIRGRWPAVTVLELGCNRGFAAAVNAGIARSRGDHVALVNNDVELDPGWLAALLAAVPADPSVAAVAGKLIDFGDRTMLEECGSDWLWDGRVRHRGEGQRDSGQYDAPAEVFSVCAAAALYRRAALDAVGPFDERFFAYFEDVDWCFRARLAGFRHLYVPGARAYHRRRATAQTALDLNRLHTRNSWLVVCKCYTPRDLLAHLPGIARRACALPLYAWRHGWLRSYLGALADFVSLTPHVRRSRRELRRRLAQPRARSS